LPIQIVNSKIDRQSVLQGALRGHVIPGVDAMRVVAIFLVVAFHMGFPFSGSLGVIIFFVLSGFLITSILLKEIQRTGTISCSSFYKRRAYRIFPAYYSCWLLTIIVIWSHHQPVNWGQAAASFFYVSDYARAFLPSAQQTTYQMGISWSLAIEEQFYLLWPVVLLWIVSKRKSVVTAVGCAVLAAWLWRTILMCMFRVPWSYSYNAFDTRVDALLVGCWLAIVLYGDLSSISRAVLRSLISSDWLVVLPLAALGVTNYIDVTTSSLELQLITFSLEPVLAGIVLVQWIYLGATSWKFLEHPVVKFVARLSYAIYLYHILAFDFGLHIPIPHTERFLRIPSILAIAAASYFWIEKPFLRIRDRGKEQSALMDDGLRR
jgi:peptidoglycan/LPS O-acetylase OafA/YrhL